MRRTLVCVAVLLLNVISVVPVSAQVAPIVSYYGNNIADGFVRSLSPMKLTGDGYSIFQAGSGKGAVVMRDSANDVNHETSAGAVILVSWTTLAHLQSITVAPTELLLTGTAHFALNLWIDTNPSNDEANGPFFTWSGDTFIGLGGDVYALGPGVGAGGETSLNVNSATPFFVIGGNLDGQEVSLSTLQSTYPDATVGIWIGLDIPQGTIGSGSVVIPPVSYPPKLQTVTTP